MDHDEIVVFAKDNDGDWLAFLADTNAGEENPFGGFPFPLSALVEGKGKTIAAAMIDLGIAMEQAELANGTKDERNT